MKSTLSDKAVCYTPKSEMSIEVIFMATRHIAEYYEKYTTLSDKSCCFISNSGMTTVVDSIVTRHSCVMKIIFSEKYNVDFIIYGNLKT